MQDRVLYNRAMASDDDMSVTAADSLGVRILPEEVANKIAAGEVVERPASVVKELIENAIDAAATRIVVRLIAAGRRTIEVVDNGYGMSEQDSLLAIERHATSKIRNLSDLHRVGSFGLRGESLARIGAAIKIDLVTRPRPAASASVPPFVDCKVFLASAIAAPAPPPSPATRQSGCRNGHRP